MDANTSACEYAAKINCASWWRWFVESRSASDNEASAMKLSELLRKPTTAIPRTIPTRVSESTPPRTLHNAPAPRIGSLADPILGVAPTAAPVRLDASTPPRSLRAKLKRRPKRLYAVTDRRGTVIGFSTKPVREETAKTHAEAFVKWIGQQDGFAGQRMLYEAAAHLYKDVFCPAQELKPFPWRRVAAELADMGVQRDWKHVDTDDWRKRMKKRVYLVPDHRSLERV